MRSMYTAMGRNTDCDYVLFEIEERSLQDLGRIDFDAGSSEQNNSGQQGDK